MKMFFPGMDPYLEHAQLWRSVHATLIVYIRDQLQPQLSPRYVATVEERVFVEGPERTVMPDIWLVRTPQRTENTALAVAVADLEADEPEVIDAVAEEMNESYIEILDVHSGQRLVTLIEVVSPTNKRIGPGRESYAAKQQEVLASQVNLVEIDLLRGGEHVLAVPEWRVRRKWKYDSLVSVNRAGPTRSRYDVYPRPLRQRLPRIRIPLAEGDADVRLDLQTALNTVYEAGCYRHRIDYSRSCVPDLLPEDQAWANGLFEQSPKA